MPSAARRYSIIELTGAVVDTAPIQPIALTSGRLCGCEGDERTHRECHSFDARFVVPRARLARITAADLEQFGQTELPSGYRGGNLVLCEACAVHYKRRGYHVQPLIEEASPC